MGTIINLDSYRTKSYPAICMDNSAPVKKMPTVEELELYVNYQEQFSIDLKNLKYKTQNHKFMFPTILHRYKRNINPVSALYNTVQEVLIFCNIFNETHLWILGLFDDVKWRDELFNAIDSDAKTLRLLIKKYNHIQSPYIEKKLKELSNMADRFDHYKEVFKSIDEWKGDNLVPH